MLESKLTEWLEGKMPPHRLGVADLAKDNAARYVYGLTYEVLRNGGPSWETEAIERAAEEVLTPEHILVRLNDHRQRALDQGTAVASLPEIDFACVRELAAEVIVKAHPKVALGPGSPLDWNHPLRCMSPYLEQAYNLWVYAPHLLGEGPLNAAQSAFWNALSPEQILGGLTKAREDALQRGVKVEDLPLIDAFYEESLADQLFSLRDREAA